MIETGTSRTTTAGAAVPVVNARAWDMICLPYVTGRRIAVVKNCFAFLFVNIGDTPATVNNQLIFPSATPATALGDARSVGAHQLDLYKGKIELKFLVPIGLNPKVEITQLHYLEASDVNTVVR